MVTNLKLLEVARQYKTPLYVYDAQVVCEKFEELKGFFNYSKLKLFYAMKANFNPSILKILLDQGACIDAVSPAEVILARRVGFSCGQILFTANMLTNDEMQEVIDEGVLFNIGSISELRRYGLLNPNSDVCIRFNPDVVSGHHEKVRTGGKDTKFGILLENIGKVKQICCEFGLRIVGVHEHTGSGIPETVDMLSGLRNIIEILTPLNFPDLKFVDFGGGFKISYHLNEINLDYKAFGQKVVELVSQVNSRFGRELDVYFEPGRYLVAQCGVLLVEATTIKNNGGKSIVGTNSGFNQLIRPMFYDSYHHIINLSNFDGVSFVYDIAGNICETGDYFAQARKVAKISEGDVLCIEDAGAYCYSMGSIYNLRAMPCEVLVDGDDVKVVSKRKSSEELALGIYSNFSG
jgi:diaminopimelate decarboxylase